MIIPIVLDTQDIMQQFNVSQKQVEDICDNVAKSLAFSYNQKLQQIVQNTLHRTRARFLQAVKLVDTGRMEGTVMIDFSKDPLVGMIEQGAGPFDMKQGFFASSKVITAKNGNRYLTIPFRWGTPNIVGDSDVFSNIMPQEVYQAVRSMPQNITMIGGGIRTQGLNPSTLSPTLQNRQTRPQITDSQGKVMFNAYQHKTSIYAGIVRKQDSITGQNTYHSFRRVSTGSTDKNAFIHKGIQQYNFVQKALQQFDQVQEVSRALDIEWKKLGF